MRAGTDVMRYSDWLSNEAMKLTTTLNNSYPHPEEIRELLPELLGKVLAESGSLFLLHDTDCANSIYLCSRGGVR